MSPVIDWLNKIANSILEVTSPLDFNFYMYGVHPDSSPFTSRVAYDRISFIFIVAKFIIWKSRNLMLFEGKCIPSGQMRTNIIRELKLRVHVDWHRFHDRKFDKFWIDGKSFVKKCDNVITFTL